MLYGWVVESDLQFPELIVSEGIPQVFVRLVREDVHKKENALSFVIDKVAQYIITGGDEITIVPHTEDESLLRLYTLGNAFGALIHQRGLLAMHGCTILCDQKGIMFCGSSGAGKSTMAAAFIRQGLQVLSDDVSIISVSKDIPYVRPSYPQIRLWDQPFYETIVERNKGVRIHPDEEKYAYRIEKNFHSDVVPLSHIYMLRRGDYNKIEEVTGVEKFEIVSAQTYRQVFIQQLNNQWTHFNILTKVLPAVRVFKLFYPDNIEMIGQVAGNVLSHVASYEK